LNPGNTIIDGENNISTADVLEVGNNGSSPLGSVTIDGITIQNGKVNWPGMLAEGWSYYGTVVLSNCIIKNSTSRYDMVLVESDHGNASVINNIIVNNTSTYGSAGIFLYTYSGNIDMTNNIIANNSVTDSSGTGGGLYIDAETTSVANVYNNIIWGNTATAGDIYIPSWSGGTINIYNNDFSTVIIFGSPPVMSNNIDADPLFVNTAAGDYHLATGSPAIDTGNNSAPSLPATDLEGNARVSGIAVDMGVYEFHPASISVAPASDSFGNGYVNRTSSAHTFTVSNTGTTGLVIGTIGLTGTNPSDFVKVSDGCSGQTVAPSASCTVQVAFAPATLGAKSALLSIPSNDPIAPTLGVPLNGIGALPVLTVNFNGTGSGTVTSTPAGIACNSDCSAPFDMGTSVTSHAAPSPYSLFAGWFDGGCSGIGDCLVTMNADTSITATFNRDTGHQVSLDGTGYYPTLQAAYDAAASGCIIKLWAVDFTEDIFCNRPVEMTFQGGYDSGYTSTTGETVIHGTVSISDGTVIVDGLSIQYL
jgi:hypothetical protein